MPDPTNNTTPPGDQQPTNENDAPLTYDAWLGQQTEDVKTLVEGNITGLKSALQSERQQRDELARQLRDAAKGSQGATKEALDKLSADLEAANTRAEFFAEATKSEIGCSNPRLAWIAAQEAGALDNRGRVNWDALKQQYPELFQTRKPPAGNAGAGTGNQPPAGKSMNDFIRTAAGRGR